MVKWIIGSIIRKKFRHEEPSRGFIVDNMRTERRGEHVVQYLLMEPGGASFVESLLTCHSGWCGV